MKFCNEHWQMARDAVEDKGLTGLVAKSGEAAMEAQARELDEFRQKGEISPQTFKETFDPLMSINWHFSGEALRCGGLYLMAQREDLENDGHYCPICEFEKHQPGFVAAEAFGSVTSQMREWCITEGLIARPS